MNIKKSLLLLAFASAAFAQLTTTNTTLSAAMSAVTIPQYAMCLASGTGVVLPSAQQAGSYIVIDGEVMQAKTNPSTGCFTVNRGLQGSPQIAHKSGALAWVGNQASGSGDSSRPFAGGVFVAAIPVGAATASQQYSLPVILIGQAEGYGRSGTAYTVYNGAWAPVNGPAYGGTVASTAGQLTITGTTMTISGTNAITGFIIPAGFGAGTCLQLIPTGAFTTTATNNIGKASTAVVGVTLFECYDGTKFNPSY